MQEQKVNYNAQTMYKKSIFNVTNTNFAVYASDFL